MYLKSIEVQGFKSFANRMKFQFHNGITGIVGPNGSGKSNVGDAVRWVLGEQSVKQLRGSNMSDVIFSGTENRKPMGFAMVAITLDNSDHKLPVDYSEVTVTRRLYRSGESEYLINGSACRLKDIKEMFYDTGIGKEGYSIIGQGQIDKILSGKPEERRELFDEAAGIVKFKRRKLAATKKLEEEHGNLTRITDILSELTRQIGPLERQSEKARIYLKKREELKQNEIDVFALEMGRVERQQKEVEEKILISDHDLASVEEKEKKIRQEYEKTEREMENLNQVIDEKKESLNQGMIRKKQLEGQINLLREQIRFAQQNDEQVSARIEALKETISESGRQQKKLEKELSLTVGELDETQQKLSGKEQIHALAAGEMEKLEEAISKGQTKLFELLGIRSNTKAKLQRYETLAEQNQIRKSVLVQQVLSSKSDQVQIEEIKEGLKKEYDEIGSHIKAIIARNDRTEKEINEVQLRISEQSKMQETRKAEYHREESRLESLRNMTERYDGYGNSIRRVMEKRSSYPGIYGVVADLIKTDKKYESAIETALGGSIQNVVTDNENTAKAMIQYLKQNKYGRATFLPLSAIHAKGGIGNHAALYEPGALGVASTLVNIDDRYEELIEYLLGKTLVVDNIDHAIAIARKYRQSVRIVTLEGDLLSPGGSMSGGAFKNSSNLLGRRREMDDLEKSIANKKNEIAATERDIADLRNQRTSLRSQLVKSTEEMQGEYIHQNTVRLKMDEMESNVQKSKSGRKLIEDEMQELDVQIRDIEAERRAIEDEMTESREKEEALESDVTRWQKELEDKKEAYEVQRSEVGEIRIHSEALKQKKAYQEQTLQRVAQEMQAASEEWNHLTQNHRNTKEDAQQKQQQILQYQESIRLSEGDEKRLQEELEQLGNRRKEKSDANKEFFRMREELTTQKGELDKERLRLDNQRERISDYLERQINYMWEEYELTKSQAIKMKSEDLPEAAVLKKKVSGLKSEIRGLGSVNVNAIEEYKEISERHTFLTQQHADLVEAEKALQKIVLDLDAGMRRQFREQFEIIQKEFTKSFTELFGGGKGTLELTEDEDILEAGIRIIAQPPGKKLINMMQMSGGEKALTAIALLFAIQNMKPSPFCLLDEIEAALDENNVSRYANYLHKLTKNTQFIIITHRRGTMAVADRLYGITMQEKGISTQVSVNMVEGELDQ